jgi:hypothetical protein
LLDRGNGRTDKHDMRIVDLHRGKSTSVGRM